MYIAMMILTFLASSLLVYLLSAPSAQQVAVWKRVSSMRHRAAESPRSEDEELSRPFFERVIQPLLEKVYTKILRLTPSSMRDKVRRRITQAGKPIDTARFLGIQVVLVLVLGLVGAALAAAGGGSASGAGGGQVSSGSAGGRALLLGVGMAFLGGFLPEFWLSTRITRRKKLIEKALPDVLDLLSVSVEAGLGFDGAIAKVSEKFGDPIAGEFKIYLKEVKVGKSRADALRALGDRTGIPDMQTFIAAIVQADQLGVSISNVLRIQSDQMREKRRQRSEEKAMKMPIKMLFPLMFFIFPTIFIVILGPAVIQLSKAFKAM